MSEDPAGPPRAVAVAEAPLPAASVAPRRIHVG